MSCSFELSIQVGFHVKYVGSFSVNVLFRYLFSLVSTSCLERPAESKSLFCHSLQFIVFIVIFIFNCLTVDGVQTIVVCVPDVR